jgi:putative FmdB family regulatory protein
MPLYEYECRKCGGRFEEIRKFSDDPLTVHEDCGGELRKLISAAAIQFKGSGFYINDYARAGKSEWKDDGGKKSDGEKKSGKSGDSKDTAKSKSESSGGSKTESSTTKSSASKD